MTAFGEYRHGALYVVEQARGTDEIQRALRRIDDRLFLEKQVGFDNVPVWCVVCAVGGDQPPVTILEWRDDHGHPIPHPTSHLLDRVARMDRDGRGLTARVIEQNRKFQESKQREMRSQIADIVHDVMPLMSETRSGLLHRGQHLRRARDRQRRQGRNV